MAKITFDSVGAIKTIHEALKILEDIPPDIRNKDYQCEAGVFFCEIGDGFMFVINANENQIMYKDNKVDMFSMIVLKDNKVVGNIAQVGSGTFSSKKVYDEFMLALNQYVVGKFNEQLSEMYSE